MKKLGWVVVLVVVVFVAMPVFASAPEAPGFVVNGRAISFDADTGYPYISESGRTMMPVRVCLSSIGCAVDWDQQSQTASATKNNLTVKIPVGGYTFYINNQAAALDTPAVVQNGRTYLPLRAILEAFGYAVDWDQQARRVVADELTPLNINGGTTGVFSRKQLDFVGWDGIEADITLPIVPYVQKGDCPYVYFGFDWPKDQGNAEGGFQFIVDENSPHLNKWTVFMRQGSDWRWGKDVVLAQGSTHHLKFFADKVSETQTDLVIHLDGAEVVRKASPVTDFSGTSVKAVIAMGMNGGFDGTNSVSQSLGTKVTGLMVSTCESAGYADFYDYPLYRLWHPAAGRNGMWYGTVDCVPSCLLFGEGWEVSI